MAKAKVRQGDTIQVLAGRDKGKQGMVSDVKDGRVIVEGVNMVSKCFRPQPNTNEEGGIRKQPASMDVSNVAVVNKATGKPCRVGMKKLEDGAMVRIDKKTGDVLEG